MESSFLIAMIGIMPLDYLLEQQQEAAKEYKIISNKENFEKLTIQTHLLLTKLAILKKAEKHEDNNMGDTMEEAFKFSEEIASTRKWQALNPDNQKQNKES